MDWGTNVRFSAIISTLLVGLALGACTMPDMDSFRAPDAASLFSARSVSNYRDKVLPPVAAADLVDANGSCAGGGGGVPPGPAPRPPPETDDAGVNGDRAPG